MNEIGFLPSVCLRFREGSLILRNQIDLIGVGLYIHPVSVYTQLHPVLSTGGAAVRGTVAPALTITGWRGRKHHTREGGCHHAPWEYTEGE